MHEHCSALPASHLRRIHSVYVSIYAPLATLQYASAFNQQIAFNTGNVKDMKNMFYVR